MDRRGFLKTSVAVSVATAVDGAARAAAPQRQPNVLYVFSDQHRVQSLPGEPHSQVIAPALDAFRRQNVSMDACISNYPLCSPHRAILMSGKYPAETGVDRNGPMLPADTLSLGETFRRAGYHTGYVGKWHLHGDEIGFIPKGPLRFGFEDWHVWDDTNAHYHAWTFNPDTGEKISPEGYSASHMTDQAVDFLKAQPADKPWFLILSWNPPHPPYNPPDQDQKPYPPATLEMRPNVVYATPGEQLKGIRHYMNSEDELKKAQQGYYGGITAIDLDFQRVLDALKESGQAENTIVIYTADHGEMMGSHGHMEKQMPHEESCHVPFFVRVPGTKPKVKAQPALFGSIDIYPSVCGLAGVPVPPHCRGKDLSAALRGEAVASQDHVFLTNQRKLDSNEQWTPTYRGLRTATHTYAVAEEGRWVLFDNVADPYQMKNLIKDPAQAARMAKFDAAIEEWIRMTGDTFPYQTSKMKYADISDTPAPDKVTAAGA